MPRKLPPIAASRTFSVTSAGASVHGDSQAAAVTQVPARQRSAPQQSSPLSVAHIAPSPPQHTRPRVVVSQDSPSQHSPSPSHGSVARRQASSPPSPPPPASPSPSPSLAPASAAPPWSLPSHPPASARAGRSDSAACRSVVFISAAHALHRPCPQGATETRRLALAP